MALETRDVVGILGDNLRLRGSVLPIPARRATAWARGLDLPRGGETVLYTGLMVQLVPYIERLVAMEERVAGSPLARFTKLGRRVNRVVGVAAFAPRPPRRERAEADAILRDIALLLRDAGVEFGYLYEEELYAGALAWDLGLDELVARHAERVHDTFHRHGVRRVITVDPHTTTMLRSVYPTLLHGWELEVRSYLEVLAERPLEAGAPLGDEVAIHDSCVFARAEGVVEEPRTLLRTAGVSVREPEHAGRRTWCCGGPAEALYPEKALANARVRVEELARAGSAGVTMCPICLVNLRKAADGKIALDDVSRFLRRADLHVA